jgi:hypothetical protein
MGFGNKSLSGNLRGPPNVKGIYKDMVKTLEFQWKKVIPCERMSHPF